MTNQSTSEAESGSLENIFSETEDTETTDETSEDSEQAEETENSEEENSESAFMNIRYNGADQALTQEQAVMLAQKGMNYDKIKGKLDAVEAQYKPIADIARKYGITPEQYVQRVGQFQEQSEIQSIAKEYQSKHPDVDDSAAKEYAEAVYKNKREEDARKAQEQERAKIAQEDQYFRDQVTQLFNYNPNIEIDKLDVSVIDDINAGIPPMEAYLKWEAKQLKTQLANKNTNAKNKANANGGLDSNNANQHSDPFLEGLLGK